MIDLRTLAACPAAAPRIDVRALAAGGARVAPEGSPDGGAASRTPSTRSVLGEHPLWDTAGDQLLWVDVLGRSVHGWSPETQVAWSVGTETAVSLVWPTDEGRLLLATASGILVCPRTADGLRPDLACAAIRSGRPAGMPASHRFNDGACDPRGRLWVSSMSASPADDLGVLYLVSACPDGLDLQPVMSGLGCGNGISWSPDGTLCYLVESLARTIYRFAVDPVTGNLHDGEVLVTLCADGPLPDGLVVDSAGSLWVAFWDGGCVLRLGPDGAVLGAWTFPTARITCPGFGAPGTTDMFVTSARPGAGPGTGSTNQGRVGDGGSTRQLDEAGAIFCFDAGVAGLPVTPFREGDPS